jgi:transcription antitermination factor NusG
MLLDSKSVFWYVLFAAHGKAKKISEYCKTANIECFFPMCNTKRRIRNSERTKNTLQPLIGNLVFVKTSMESFAPHLEEIKRRFSITSELYYRDLGSREIIVVPENQMRSFIVVAGCGQEKTIYLSNEDVNLEKGTRVRITGGILTGVEGVFMRIKGDRRVVVRISNLFSVATAFIPLEFILPLE